MTGMGPLNLYESPGLQAAIGPALRPGGMELTRRALSFCDLPADSLILDIGCGTGATGQFLRQRHRFKSFGLDSSSVMLRQAASLNPGLPLLQGVAAHLPFRDGLLSAVVCECVLSLLKDAAAAWQEIYRVLKIGGYLVWADVYARDAETTHLLESVAATCCLRGARSRDDLLGCIHQNGFSLLAWEDHSQHLKHLAARLAFAGWPLQSFWKASGTDVSGQEIHKIIRRARPGYFLMVALKRGG